MDELWGNRGSRGSKPLNMYLMYLASLPCPFFLSLFPFLPLFWWHNSKQCCVLSHFFSYFQPTFTCHLLFFPLPSPIPLLSTTIFPLTLTPASNPLFFPTSYNQLHEGSWHCNFVDWKILRLCNIYVPSPDIRVVRVARRYPEGVRSTEVRKGVFYDDNDNIYVIHRRQEILVLLTLNFTHYILLYTILKLLCCDCPFLFWFLAVERTVVTTWCSVWNMVM